jgi:hypothetical protein
MFLFMLEEAEVALVGSVEMDIPAVVVGLAATGQVNPYLLLRANLYR